MKVTADVWLRGTDFATTDLVADLEREADAWVDEDVRQVLEGMLKAMHRLKHKGDSGQPVSLRGLSWIVNPYDDGGVVIAIEITLGAAIAGPFRIDKPALEAMIARVLIQRPSTSVH